MCGQISFCLNVVLIMIKYKCLNYFCGYFGNIGDLRSVDKCLDEDLQKTFEMMMRKQIRMATMILMRMLRKKLREKMMNDARRKML